MLDGRVGLEIRGTCVTFITPEQDRYSVDIYRALKASNATVPKDLEDLANGESICYGLSIKLNNFAGFLDKLKTGKAHAAGSGFGGKGLDRLDKERDAREKAERKAYGEPDEEKTSTAEEATAKATASNGDDMTFGNFKVEIRRGPAPDSSKGLLGVGGRSGCCSSVGTC